MMQPDTKQTDTASPEKVIHPPNAGPSSENYVNLATTSEDKPKERSVRGLRWFLVCFSIFSANLLYGLDTTIVADIQGAISETYDNTTQLGWLGVGFTLGSTVLILPLGKFFATFDCKWIFIGCLLNFAAASALCGAAPNMDAMIVGRVWAGAGGAGMYLGTLNLSTALSLPHEQPFYVGITGFVYGSGCILGPVVGGLMADSAATWRWAFYLNLVIFGALAPIYLFVLPSVPRRKEEPFAAKLGSMDWVGIVLNGAMYCCFTLAFAFGGIIWPWSDARVIVLLVVFALCIAGFIASQYWCVFVTAADRIFPVEFLRDPQLVLLYIIMSCGGASLFVSVYYIPLYFLFAHDESGTEAAVRLLPFICCYVATILICGAFMIRVGYHSIWFICSGVLLTAGAAAMYTVRTETPAANIAGYTVLVGLGMATTQAGYAVGNLLVESSRAADLIQFLNISQGSSQLIGLAIASAVFQSETFSRLQNILSGTYSDDEIQSAIAGTRSAVFQEVSPEVRAACTDAIVAGIGRCWLLVVAAGALYTICSCFLTRSRFITPKGRGTEPAGSSTEA